MTISILALNFIAKTTSYVLPALQIKETIMIAIFVRIIGVELLNTSKIY
jgi:diacylglycerol kinase